MKARKLVNRRVISLETIESRRYLAAHIVGSATNYATIQAAVDAVSPGATINVDAGTYNETVQIYKSLNLRGAQAGVDARNARGAETRVYATQTVFDIYANGVTIDGFVIEGNRADIGAQLGAGVLMRPNIHGTHVYNNVIQNNVTGIYLSNNSNTDAAIIQRNLIQNNFEANNYWTKEPGENGSRGIYTDGTVSGGYLTNALIDSNRLFNSDFNGGNEDMGMISLQALTAGKQFNITITNNYIGNESKALLATNVTNLVFMGNYCTALNDGPSGPVRFEGNANTVNIQYNTVTGNAGPGVAVDSAGVPGDSSGFVVNNNNLYGNNSPIGLIVVADVYNGPLTALNNWWGNASGPGGLGTGTGTQVWGNGKTGHGVTATGLAGGGPVYFSPWATALVNISNIPVPASPTGLYATGQTSSTMLLTWTAPMSTAVSQQIQRSTDGVNFVTIATVPPLLNTYTDTGLTSGTAYTYRIVATNFTGSSAPSATSTGTPPAYQPPAAPTNLLATGNTGSTVTLAWALPSNGTGIASYTIYRNGVAVGTSTSLGFTDAGLTSSSTYSYAVATTDNQGATSVRSTPITATTTAAQFGDPSFESGSIGTYVYNPSNPFWTFSNASGIATNGSLLKAANAPNGVHVGFLQNTGAITQTMKVGVGGTYTITFSSARRSNFATDPIAVSVDGTTIATITPASAGAWGSSTTATFTLGTGSHTFKFAGTSATTASYSFIDAINLKLVSPSAPPAAPSGVTAFGSTATQITLSWLIPGITPTTYTLLRSTDNVTFTTLTTTLTGTATTYTDSAGLAGGTTYYYKLIAVNPAGASAPSAVVSARTLSNAATTKALSSLNWASAGTGYGTVQKDASIAGNPITLKGKTYTSGIGTHAFSNITYNLNGAYSLFQADVGVDDEVGSTKPAAVDFQVFGDGVLLYDSGVLTRSSATQSINVSVAGVQSLAILASNGIAGSIDYDHADWAGATLVSSPQAPNAPAALSASGLTTTSIKLAWMPGTGGTATSYSIERSLDGTAWSPVTTVSSAVLSYTDTGLATGTTYFYRVMATNGVGNSGYSATASARPLAPTAVTTPLSSLNWTSATAGYGSVQKNLNASGDPINLNGTVYASGVGTHADSTIVYNLAGAYTSFQSDIGFDFRTNGHTSDPVRFQVIGDGKVLFDSNSMSNADPVQSISVDVTGVTTLSLVANAVVPGNIDYDHVDWAGAKLISA